jgi:hypothetical protein
MSSPQPFKQGNRESLQRESTAFFQPRPAVDDEDTVQICTQLFKKEVNKVMQRTISSTGLKKPIGFGDSRPRNCMIKYDTQVHLNRHQPNNLKRSKSATRSISRASQSRSTLLDEGHSWNTGIKPF